MMINPDFAQPILTLANYLTDYNIPHTINVIWDGLQIRFPWNDGDIICHSGSYGHTNGMVESMGCPWDEGDVSYLDIDDIFERLVKWYSEEVGA